MRRALLALALLAPAACSSTAASGPGTTISASTTTAGATLATTAASSSTSTSSTVAPSTSTSTSALSTTLAPATSTSVSSTSTTAASPKPADYLGGGLIGTSVEGRPIMAEHRGTPGGTVVLVIGDIHGDEHAGIAILDDLRQVAIPHGIDLWLIDSVNPDGVAHDVRGNAHGVDLNRNFPYRWAPLAAPGDWEYAGPSAASEPETQAFVAFALRIHPALTLWYHQDLARVSPSTGADGPLRQRYAELTGLAYSTISGGTYTGVAATWVRTQVPKAMSFVIELGPTLSPEQALVHASAVLDIAQRV